MDAEHSLQPIRGRGRALVVRLVVHPRANPRSELPAAASGGFRKHLGDGARSHHAGFADQEARAGPVKVGVPDEFDAANATLGQLDVVTLVLQHVPESGALGHPALAHQQSWSPIEQDNALQAEHVIGREIGRLTAQYFLQCGSPRFEDLAQALALFPPIWFSGSASDPAFCHSRRYGAALSVSYFPDRAAQDRTKVGRFLPAAQLLAVLPDGLQDLIEALPEGLAGSLHDHLLAFHGESPESCLKNDRRFGHDWR